MSCVKVVIILLVFALFGGTASAADTGEAPQSPLKPGGAARQQYPRVVLYSTSWCPHCRAAKEYFTSNNIPFINKDVEVDDVAMEELTKKYKSQGVPLIVIGNDDKVLKGFNREVFEKALKEVQQKK